jgi:hypothetical protein
MRTGAVHIVCAALPLAVSQNDGDHDNDKT